MRISPVSCRTFQTTAQRKVVKQNTEVPQEQPNVSFKGGLTSRKVGTTLLGLLGAGGVGVIGFLIGGPVGAVIGGAIGGAAGVSAGKNDYDRRDRGEPYEPINDRM